MPEIKIGNYLFTRLKQLGVSTVFSVPGDYELALLDLIGDSGVEFAGNPNELIAAYAADGYSRLKGVGAWVDTYGPGELSSYCGQAGQYTELVPVAHVVGYPGRDAMRGHMVMHHTLGTSEFDMFEKMASQISATTTVLLNPKTTAAEIDRCLTTMLQESRPVYIGVPVDMSHLTCDSSGLDKPIHGELPPNEPELEKGVVGDLRMLLEQKKSPIFIVDGNACRNYVTEECGMLAKLTGLLTFTTSMGRGGIDEELPNFGGVCSGLGSYKEVREAVEGSDAVFWIGNFPSDFNTGEFTEKVGVDVAVDFQRFFVKIGAKKFLLKMKYLLRALIKSLEDKPLARTSTAKVDWDPYPLANIEKSPKLTQDYLWAATSSSARPVPPPYGISASKLPTTASMFNQTVFGSIGYATGAIVGAAKAIKENKAYRRCILVTGEGSLQLTAQAFADMLKLELNPYRLSDCISRIILNSAATPWNAIHGKDAPYNKVGEWDYSLLAKTFGPAFPSKYWGQIDTCEGLEEVFADKEFNEGEMCRVLELKLGYLDAPANILALGPAIDGFNRKK
ncbi:Pyruvate decarboxylase 1 [Saxophila tyrrhenica]|uniref:Pyruvate decarboxylase n=1 Tax=Saxophila tyrrhenica TaxID=1690608 RepID=A0AAV9PFJ3_9PEZI|nr:Pyruvate decarboxylase 1 [Saxophila tyrrhenica]